ncbi:hypothetical protein MNO14_06025 [Luteimonas sp. S4-F44]|uniref:hypothetical protein n=1 Tax=Luteimonas sp. S4-F44 TaxID=2925842 RepID=UPI001F536FED|nr:hypothetical protein [Luteimonas sp. S4-F44]UNK43624.1 hypothetical protein MNO14_06025 [Luteimonas sp. S4-F44]
MLLFAGLVVADAQAQQRGGLYAVPCEGCSVQQMREVADAELDIGGVIVYNLANAQMISIIKTPYGVMHDGPISAELQYYFDDLVGLYQANGNSLDYIVELTDFQGGLSFQVASQPDNLPLSATEALASSSRMNNLRNYLYSTYVGYIAGAHTFLRPFNPVTWLNPDYGLIRTQVIFPDGSSIVLYFDPGSNDVSQWTYSPGTARDANNNSIPQNAEEFAGGGYREYDFSGLPQSSINDWVNWAAMNGIPVTGGQTGRMGCTSAGGSTVCTWIAF